uniref:Uncharacterized protein n=1 Tax=Arion vulgaris TaxID=1028688 RepID=A0A0B6ZQ95_9EUPU
MCRSQVSPAWRTALHASQHPQKPPFITISPGQLSTVTAAHLTALQRSGVQTIARAVLDSARRTTREKKTVFILQTGVRCRTRRQVSWKQDLLMTLWFRNEYKNI